MKAIIIAAGRGKRLGSFTDNAPKPLVDIDGSSFFQNTIEKLHNLNITDIAAVVGYKKEQFERFKNIKLYENANWKNNNILHSLFCARRFMDDDLIIVYSDIWFNQKPFDTLLNVCDDDISICVDSEWESYYINRTNHPISQAENVLYDENGVISKIGKHINENTNNKLKMGEFMGLLKIPKQFIHTFIQEFEKIEKNISLSQSFQSATNFENAYLTDFIQHLIDKKYNINCCLNKKNWYEVDTIQDLENLKKIHNERK